MALVKTEDITLQARGFNGLSLFRQLGLMQKLFFLGIQSWRDKSPDLRK